jgi:hypothetical protein
MTVDPLLRYTRMSALVGGGGAVGGNRFLGVLEIYPDCIVFTSAPSLANRMFAGPALPGQIVHTSKEVVLIKSRLLPPWYNSAIVLNGKSALGEGRTAAVGMAFFMRRRLGRILRETGFHVVELQGWVSLGGSGSQWELPRQRPKR